MSAQPADRNTAQPADRNTAPSTAPPAEVAWSYVGVFDDRVAAYPGGLPPVDASPAGKEFLNKLLLRALYFGRPVAINDGYLLQHPFLRSAIWDNDSFLRILGRAGYIKLLKRNPDQKLVALADWAREHDVGSLGKAVEAMKPGEWPNYRHHLEVFEQEVQFPMQVAAADSFSSVIRWPVRDTAAGFKLLMADALDNNRVPSDFTNEALPEFEEVRSLFLQYIQHPENAIRPGEKNPPPPRTYWERAVKTAFHADEDDRAVPADPRAHRLMEYANVIYHLNFAACFAAEGAPCDVMTISEMSLLEYFGLDAAEGELPAQVPEVLVPNHLFALDKKFVQDFIRNDGINQRKRAYLQAIEQFLAGQASREKARAAAADYQKEIDAVCCDERTRYCFEHLFILAGLAGDVALGVATGQYAIAAATAAIGLVSGFGCPVARKWLCRLTAKATAAHLPNLPRQSKPPLTFLRPAGKAFDNVVAQVRELPPIYAAKATT